MFRVACWGMWRPRKAVPASRELLSLIVSSVGVRVSVISVSVSSSRRTQEIIRVMISQSDI